MNVHLLNETFRFTLDEYIDWQTSATFYFVESHNALVLERICY
jgi:hypothetical protein